MNLAKPFVATVAKVINVFSVFWQSIDHFLVMNAMKRFYQMSPTCSLFTALIVWISAKEIVLVLDFEYIMKIRVAVLTEWGGLGLIG